jgi:hypothetical protein
MRGLIDDPLARRANKIFFAYAAIGRSTVASTIE